MTNPVSWKRLPQKPGAGARGALRQVGKEARGKGVWQARKGRGQEMAGLNKYNEIMNCIGWLKVATNLMLHQGFKSFTTLGKPSPSTASSLDHTDPKMVNKS